MHLCVIISSYFLATPVIHFWQVVDANAKSGEQAEHKNHLNNEYSGKPNQFPKEVVSHVMHPINFYE